MTQDIQYCVKLQSNVYWIKLFKLFWLPGSLFLWINGEDGNK